MEDLATGDRRWIGATRGGSYSSPHLLTTGGVAQVLLMNDANYPWLILVPRIEAWFEREPGARERQTELLPPKRIGTPEEVAYTALFLASDEARYINATDILIDGGRSQVYHE